MGVGDGNIEGMGLASTFSSYPQPIPIPILSPIPIPSPSPSDPLPIPSHHPFFHNLSVYYSDAEERKKLEALEGQSNEASDKKPEPEKKPADNKSAPKGN